MKKGIILEERENYSIVLTADGSFEKAIVTDPNASIGQEVSYQPYVSKRSFLSKISWRSRFISLAVIFVVILFSSYYFVADNATYAYVNVEINPSIELKVNRDLTVQGITALNKDAEQLVQQLKQKEITLEAMLYEIMDSCEKRIMDDEGNQILIGVSYADQQDGEITNNIKEYFQTANIDWQIVTFRVPGEVRERALKNDTSMIKEIATLLQSGDETILGNIDEDKRDIIHSFYYTNTKTKGMFQEMELVR